MRFEILFLSLSTKECAMSNKEECVAAHCRRQLVRRWLRPLICMPLIGLLSGCGSSQGSDRVPVFPASGKLVYAGQSLAGAYVVLHPKGADAGHLAPRPHAQAAADGSFSLTSYDTNDGAAAGDYTLTVELRPLVKNGGDYTAGPNILPVKYSRAVTSPVSVQIAAGRNDLQEIQILK
jgi:hypothetical protein